MNKQSFLFLLLACLVISCRKEPVKPDDSVETYSLATARFTDITTKMPVKNIKVIITGYFNGSEIVDSAYTDTNGSIKINKKRYFQYRLRTVSSDYFDEVFQLDAPDYSEVNLFPKTAVNIHFKQVNQYKNSIAYDNLVLLPEVEGFWLNSTNTLNLVTLHLLCSQLHLQENTFIDTTIKGYLHKSIYNSIKYSIARNWGSEGYEYLKSENLPMINPSDSIPNEILVVF